MHGTCTLGASEELRDAMGAPRLQSGRFPSTKNILLRALDLIQFCLHPLFHNHPDGSFDKIIQLSGTGMAGSCSSPLFGVILVFGK